MNLEMYVRENPEVDLVTTNAYMHKVDTLQVGAGQARGFFINEDADVTGNAVVVVAEHIVDGVTVPESVTPLKLWAFFETIKAGDKTNALFPMSSGIVITATDASSYFGMDESKSDGIANRAGLAALVFLKVMTQASADAFIEMVFTKSTPFTAVTQAQLDAMKSQVNLSVQLESYETLYNDVPGTHVIKGNREELVINIAYDMPVPIDTVVRLRTDSFDEGLVKWVEETRDVAVLRYPVGASIKQHRVASSVRQGSRKTRYWAISDTNLPLMVTVKVV